MARPTVRDSHVDAAMTNVSIKFFNIGYIAEQVFPVVPVTKKSDKFFVFGKDVWFRDLIQPRAPGDQAVRVDFDISTASYSCQPYALAKTVTDEQRANSDAPLRPDVTATQFVTDKLLMGQEIRVANIVSTSTNWASASNLSSGTKWSSDSSTPVANIITLQEAVRQSIGREPNVAVMGATVMKRLKDHPEMIDRIKFTRAGAVLTIGDLEQWFDIPKWLIGKGIKVTSQEGAATVTADIWGDFLWMGWVPPNAAIDEPAAGYVFEWLNRQTEVFREPQRKQDVFTTEHHTDERITASDSGAIYSDLL